MRTQLKPCPFCGCADIKLREVDTILQYVEFYVVRCQACGANIEEESPEIVSKKWNTRAGEEP
jgi:Lar family restriction alleviation protein